VPDFKELVEDGYFFWDRSLFIKEFFESDAKVRLYRLLSGVLVFRSFVDDLNPSPSSLGKTLVMSMVKYFFDISQQQRALKLFADSILAKENSRFYEENCGQHPVVFVSFADCTDNTW
jgi:hypothetical protein